jgi:hypothetical protein
MAERRRTASLKEFSIGPVLALLALFSADLVLLIGGFRLLHWVVSHWPKDPKGRVSSDVVNEIRASVNSAGLLYLRSVRCLQRSAVLTCLLRSRGINADWVIGCRKIPFMAHAWVEVDGVVVSDDPRILKIYSVLDRC